LVGAVWLATLGTLTWAQIPIYANYGEVWGDTIRKNPNCWIAQLNRGEWDFAKGNILEAREHFLKAIELDPTSAISHYGAGKTYWLEGFQDPDKAKRHFEETIRLKPYFEEARFHLATLLQQTGQVDAAIEQYRLAIASSPVPYWAAYRNLGITLASEKRYA